MENTEKEELFGLICKHFGLPENTKPNTWDQVKLHRNSLQYDSGLNLPKQRMEKLWSKIQADNEWQIDRNEEAGENPVDAFTYYIDSGLYPPPEVCIAIARCFKIYLEGEGDFSLEDVFFGSSKKGVGNSAARRAKEDPYKRFSIFLEIRKNSPKSPDQTLEAIAEEFLLNGQPFFDPENLADHLRYFDHDAVDSVESFLKGYRRWQRRNELAEPDASSE